MRNTFIGLLALLVGLSANASIKHVKLVQQFGLTGQLQQILPVLNNESGLKLSVSDFAEVENRPMANYHFVTYLQLFQGVPVKGAMIRTWESLEDGHLVMVEAHLDDGVNADARNLFLRKSNVSTASLAQSFLSRNSRNIVRDEVAGSSDNHLGRISSEDQWNGNDLEKVVKVHGKRGIHTLTYSHFQNRLKSHTYVEYPKDDIQALVYPVYEEVEGTHQIEQRIPVTLTNVNNFRREVKGDPYAALRGNQYLASKQDDYQGISIEGQQQGYWSLSGLKTLMRAIQNAMPMIPNTFASGGVYLEGKYGTINIHPDAKNYAGVTVPLVPNDKIFMNWLPVDGSDDYRLELDTPYHGQILADAQAALNRPARRLPDHDPASYLNDGFDEIQVYYAINTLVESLHGMGFTDPELSTRPFHAFLYNPDVEMRDNAFYTDDTINFTTYSPDAINYARDNSTIWHELGHGIMDRLMGDRITLADTGGLSEGMADFVAQIIIQHVTNGVPFDGSDKFRIINGTNFYMTNEVHDDGEAYGGAMRDAMTAAFAKEGQTGLTKFADITMDAMRLARNHPALTANDWFDSLLLADQLGHKGLREPNEMHDLIVNALQHRNFRFDRGTTASFTISTNGNAIEKNAKGTRENPFVHHVQAGGQVDYDVNFTIADSETYQFKYPVTVELVYNTWALQGAVKWADETTRTFTLNGPGDSGTVHISALSGCHYVNRGDGACQDYSYFRVYNHGETKPVAKKRFYLRMYTDSASSDQSTAQSVK